MLASAIVPGFAYQTEKSNRGAITDIVQTAGVCGDTEIGKTKGMGAEAAEAEAKAPDQAQIEGFSLIMQMPELAAEQEAWWRNFWSKSFVVIRGDADAECLNRLWYVNLYSLALTHAGSYPPRFSGGLGSVRKDQRSWGHGFWFQNQRQISWPLGAANHLELWRKQLDFYDSFFDYRQRSPLDYNALSGRIAPEENKREESK